jgi:hypothetical protein
MMVIYFRSVAKQGMDMYEAVGTNPNRKSHKSSPNNNNYKFLSRNA